MFKYHKRTRQLTSSNQPIACLSDQQAGHVTHRTTSASKNSSQGLFQQLSNLQVRRGIKEILNGGNLQQAEFNTKDSCKIALATIYRVYGLVLATQPCTLASTTGYRVYRLATQPCAVASITGYRVYRPGTGYTALVQLTRPPPPPPTGYRVIRPSPFNSVLILGQVDRKYLQIWLQLTGYSLQITRPVYRLYSLIFTKTGCRVITSTIGYRACRQGTGYTTLLHQNRLQSLPT